MVESSAHYREQGLSYMIPYQQEDRARMKRLKIEQAVNLAMQSRWAEAAELNRQLIETYPKDVEAHNRLAKSLMELSRLDEAREMYNHTLRLDPMNTIPRKTSGVSRNSWKTPPQLTSPRGRWIQACSSRKLAEPPPRRWCSLLQWRFWRR